MRLRTILTTLLISLLFLTSGIIGWIAYTSSRHALKFLTANEFTLANESAAGDIADYLDNPASRLLGELVTKAQRGMLTLNDDQSLGMDLAERLRTRQELAWISYSDARTGQFIGVWRKPGNTTNTILLDRTMPGSGERQEIVTPEGKLVPVPPSSSEDYDPRTRPWFIQAMNSTGTVWSDPYEFTEGKLGITASCSWRPAGAVASAGVFTVDFYLDDLKVRLNDVADTVQGFACILKSDGQPFCASQRLDSTGLTAALSEWVKANPQFKNISRETTRHLIPIECDGQTYLTALYRVETNSGLKCIVASMVPESVIYSEMRRATNEIALIALAAFSVAVLAGWFVAYRVSEPLQNLGRDLARVGKFHLDSDSTSHSFVREINQVRDAASRMKSGLRSFIRYVPDDLVRQLLSSGKDATLGGEMRHLTIFFSDIAGFTSYGEKNTPEVLVRELSSYFGILSDTLRQHSATIDKFIGDGLLAFFNAPLDIANHENLACRGSLVALNALRTYQQDTGAAPFRTRLGLHCGDVLVGNIGTADRFAYTVIGDAVNVTSRLEALNKVYGTEIIASQTLHEHAGEDFEWRHLDRVAVAGRQGGMDIFELIGLRDEVDGKILQARDVYVQALNLYFNRRFDEAGRLFVQAAQNRPEDLAAKMMAERCGQMILGDYHADWDGVYSFAKK